MNLTETNPVRLPYDKSFLELRDTKGIKAVLRNRLNELPRNGNESQIVTQALNEPIMSRRLEELAKDCSKICVVTSDHTRPMPSRITLPLILERIRRTNPNAEITILIATGFHRRTTQSELAERFGAEIVAAEKIVVHESSDDSNMVSIGTLPSGGPCLINRIAAEADLLIAEGFIEPHFFAGFSGGRKSILPGIASQKTVMANHNSKFIADSNARTGILDENPLHIDMSYAAEEAGLAFILNVVLDENKRIVHAVAGHYDQAHRSGCEWFRKLVGVQGVKGDIVVTTNGGYPLDQNIYQAVKGMTAAESCCRDGGIIVMVAGCADGHGGESFHRAVRKAVSPEALYEEIIQIPAEHTQPDQWEYQILARILCRMTVILVSDLVDHHVVSEMKMLPAADLETAMEMARGLAGSKGLENPELIIIPDGVGVIIE